MIIDTVIWLIMVAVVAALAIGFALPATRPYAKKYWWMAAAIFCLLGALVLLRRPAGRTLLEAKEEGKDIADQNLGMLDSVVERAQLGITEADVELHVKTIAAEDDRRAFMAEVEATERVTDSYERRKALIALMKDYA